MLHVACVNVGNYEGRGEEYVNKLYAAIAQYLAAPHRFVCLTGGAKRTYRSEVETVDITHLNIDGWFNKLALFQKGLFPDGDRVLYFDLDTVFVGDLDDIAGYKGRIAAMSDITSEGLASGVMAWEAGRNRIWELWERAGRPENRRGDQQWITFVERMADRLQVKYPGQLVSYKADVEPFGNPPDGARVVYFHGKPRPHEVDAPWNKAWNTGD